MRLFSCLFHSHRWKLISANVSGRLAGFAACATLECEECGKRQYFEKGNGYFEDQFPSKGAAKTWVDSLLPQGHKNLEIIDTKLVKDE